jgi:cellulose biosynthesis protein BcsQ
MSVEPLILAVASGKGGVGKTMLSVACAYELSVGGPTLLLDFDFFNRGLAGLFPQGEIIAEVPRPAFLAASDPAATEPWCIIRIAPDLYHVTYPDLSPAELSGLEISTVVQIRESIGRFIAAVREKCGAHSIVIDCHGGPDHASFAAAAFAQHTLLISEPDRVTFHGTLNFLRQLDRALGDLRNTDPHATADVRLVFNKIIPAIRAPFLRRLYDQNLREAFGDFDLLAIFPLELHLAKAFEETPLVTRAYPYSLLARKMRVLLLDLLETRAKDYLAPSACTLPSWVRKYRRRTLGRVPWFLNLEVILQIITSVTFVFLVISFLDKHFVAEQRPAFYRAAVAAAEFRHGDSWLTNDFPHMVLGVERLKDEAGNWHLRIEAEDLFPPVEQKAWLTPDMVNEAITLFGPGFSTGSANGDSFTDRSTLDWPIAQRHFVANIAGVIHPANDKAGWERDLATLRSTHWWNWLLHSIRLWWHDWYWHATALAIAWLGIAFYLDCTRKIDAAFVRALMENYYVALLWLALAIGMWTIPALYIINGTSVASGRYLTEREAVGWLLLLPYLFVIGNQLYRCYRLQHESLYDLMRRETTWRGRFRNVLALARMNTSLGQELYLRVVFVFALVGALVLFYVLLFHGGR